MATELQNIYNLCIIVVKYFSINVNCESFTFDLSVNRAILALHSLQCQKAAYHKRQKLKEYRLCFYKTHVYCLRPVFKVEFNQQLRWL